MYSFFLFQDMSAVEYNRYLQEVVQLLENDADFRSKLEKSDPEDIRVSTKNLSLFLIELLIFNL